MADNPGGLGKCSFLNAWGLLMLVGSQGEPRLCLYTVFFKLLPLLIKKGIFLRAGIKVFLENKKRQRNNCRFGL